MIFNTRELIPFFLSMAAFLFILWNIAIINKPTLNATLHAIKTEWDGKDSDKIAIRQYVEKLEKEVFECKLTVEELHRITMEKLSNIDTKESEVL